MFRILNNIFFVFELLISTLSPSWVFQHFYFILLLSAFLDYLDKDIFWNTEKKYVFEKKLESFVSLLSPCWRNRVHIYFVCFVSSYWSAVPQLSSEESTVLHSSLQVAIMSWFVNWLIKNIRSRKAFSYRYLNAFFHHCGSYEINDLIVGGVNVKQHYLKQKSMLFFFMCSFTHNLLGLLCLRLAFKSKFYCKLIVNKW